MNTYNENLRSAAETVLREMELEIKKLKSQFNAAMFTLYYAQGANMTAQQKLSIEKFHLNEKELLKDLSVNIGTVSTNALHSLNQEKTYVEQSVSNAAVCASNVQIAANAIVRLASDTASIFSTVNAADFGTEIYEHSRQAYEATEKAAFNGELASQWAMEASGLTAAISSDALKTIASETDNSIKKFIADSSEEYQKTSESVVDSNSKLSEIIIKEKAAEGRWKEIHAEYNAAVESYRLSNKEVNQDLNVTNTNASSYDVSFNQIRSLYNTKSDEGPVSAYYIFLVKEQNKSVFNLSNAEKLIQGESTQRFYKVPESSQVLNPSEGENREEENNAKISCTIMSSSLLDTEGEEISLGKNYVIFVLATFTESLKKHLNSFDDYLSSPSFPFALTKKLECPLPEDFCFKETYVLINGKDTKELEEQKNEFTTNTYYTYDGCTAENKDNPSLNDNPGILKDVEFSFSMNESKNNHDGDVEFRCIFLPISNGPIEIDNLNKKTINLFNKQLAQQVTAANYSIAELLLPKTTSKKNNDETRDIYEVMIDSSTTDNYGNPLIKGQQYIPIVLAVSQLPEDKRIGFSPAISNFQDTSPFTYSCLNPINQKF